MNVKVSHWENYLDYLLPILGLWHHSPVWESPEAEQLDHPPAVPGGGAAGRDPARRGPAQQQEAGTAQVRWGLPIRALNKPSRSVNSTRIKPLQGPSTCWKCLLVLKHFRIYEDNMGNRHLNTVSRLEIETPTKKKIKKLQTKWPVDYDLWELLIGPNKA